MGQQGEGRLPDVIVIGAHKCGTTGLHDYLGQHPEIFMSHRKELHYFSGGRGWARGEAWYRRQFHSDKRLCGESSPGYTHHPQRPHAPERMHALVPQAKLIYIVRDPIRRLLSHYLHSYADRKETRPLAEVLARQEDNPYLLRGCYAYQLTQYQPYYPPSQIHVICQEEMAADTRAVLRGVFRFLGVDEHFDSPLYDQVIHDTASKRHKSPLAAWLGEMAERRPLNLLPAHVRRAIGRVVYAPITQPLPRQELSPDMRARLQAYFAPDAAQLRAMTGMPFAEWSV
jgi:hypothetical protein